MQKTTLLIILILLGVKIDSSAQNLNVYQNDFDNAYNQYSQLPKGLLEAIAFTQTRFQDIHHPEHSCIGLPEAEGVMGLIADGEGYFNNNQLLVSQLSGVGLAQMGNPSVDVMAFAKAYDLLMNQNSVATNDFVGHEMILRLLSEIPTDTNVVNAYALSAHTFQIFQFLRDEENQAYYNFPTHAIDLVAIYGSENYKVLSSKKVSLSAQSVSNADGVQYVNQNKSAEYTPALWVATPTCNYSSRSGTPISAVTIHTIQGSYAGAISWAQNCNANVSYHYVVRSTDGQVTQMVLEADKGWHVGSENPYTIGIEHEGYVNDPIWYTTSLYTSSADLCRDITQSGYGINPLRTYFGAASTGTNLLGGCTKIKGHQHYPNQSHTDPGINWNWEYFYQLINNTPIVQNLSASSGVTYDSGGIGGDYANDERELYLINPLNVLSVTINFDLFNIEQDWDYLYVYDGDTTTAPLLGIYTGTTVPASLTSSGDAILLEFRSDCATTGVGWEISWTSIPGPLPGDLVAPTTAVNVAGNWQTTDFTASFTDIDNLGGSGVHHQLYQVIDFDGTEWRANASNGFFSDNFDLAIHPDWTAQVGSWNINSAVLNQSDEANVNTNIHAALNQDNYDQWLYHFSTQISGSGGNKRAGFHFMCDNPALTNRGNSYFIWLRADNNKVQIYKTVNDVFSLEVDVPFTINDNQWYDVKTVFDKTTGSIQLFIDNSLAASWIDPSPYNTGNSISMRSGDCIMDVNDLKVYHSRGSNEIVTIGTGFDIQYQNVNPLTHAAKIKSIAIDSSANVSAIAEQLVNVDWTSPTSVTTVNDGLAADINITNTNTEISANWLASTDAHSDLARYWYSVGTAPGLTDVVPWTDNWYNDTVTHSGLSLTQGFTYYVCVYSENGAGLFSDTICSDGQTVQPPTAVPDAGFIVQNSYICALETIQIMNSSSDAQTYSWSVPGAIPSMSTDVNPFFTFTATGYYNITLQATGLGGVDTEVQTIYVNIDTIPDAAFIPSDWSVDITNAFVSFANNSQHANGYLWDFADGNISTDISPWHQFTSTGSFNVMLIAVNGNCPNDTTYGLIEVVSGLGIEDEIQGVDIYPNPVKNDLNIHLDNSWESDVSIELVDVRGRTVYSNSFENNHAVLIRLQENKIDNGVYFLRISDKYKSGTQKIVVKKE